MSQPQAAGHLPCDADLSGMRRFYESIFSSLDQAIAVIGPDYRIKYLNEKASSLWGPSLSPARPCYTVRRNHERPCAECPMERVMATGESVRREIQVIDRNGRSSRWEFTAMPYLDKNGRPMGIVDVGQNISPLKTIAQRLQSQNRAIHDRCEYLESQLDVLRDYCAMVAGESKHGVLTLRGAVAVGASKGLLQMFGFDTVDALRGRTFESMLAHESRDLAAQLVSRWAEGYDGSECAKMKAVCADGTLIDIRVKPNGGEGAAPGVLRLDITDITALQQSEADAGDAAFALFDDHPDEILIVDENRRIEYLNPPARDIYGFAEGQRCYEAMHGAEAPCSGCVIDRLSNEPATVLRNMVERQERVVEEAVRILRAADGRQRLLIASRDVTHCAQSGVSSPASQKMEAIGLLAGKIAHDFNNILAGILGAASLIKELAGSGEDSEIRACAELIEKSSQTGRELTRNLQLFATGGKVRRRAVQLNDTLVEAAELFRKAMGGKWTLDAELAGDLWAVETDPGQMHQIVMNLCKNAAEAMPRGGRIALQSRNTHLSKPIGLNGHTCQPGRYVEVIVRDRGEGMDSDALDKCFEPMFSTKGKGRGFGLATVFGIVRSHGGWVTIDSRKGVGTTLSIGLPASAKAPSAEPPAARIGGMPRGAETVLLVDDEPAIRDTAARMLAGLGYTVRTAADGQEAVECMDREGRSIALVILDVVMPRMGGAEAHKLIRQRWPGVRIMISSGYEIDGPPKAILGDPQTSFLQKPYRMNELAESVRKALTGIAIS